MPVPLRPSEGDVIVVPKAPCRRENTSTQMPAGGTLTTMDLLRSSTAKQSKYRLRPRHPPAGPSVLTLWQHRKSVDLWIRAPREFRDFDDFRESALAEFELALVNLERFDPGFEGGCRNFELGRRSQCPGHPAPTLCQGGLDDFPLSRWLAF